MVRWVSREDLAAVVRLEEMCFSIPWSNTAIEEAFANELYRFVAVEEKGVIVGYANFRIVADEGEIERVAVHPDSRRRGYGRKLMEAMVEYSRKKGVRDMTLDVRVNNEKAINLYESCGFVEEGRRKDYYREPTEDAIIMWRRGI
ncbi:MAG: ribosomal protein S18-alanine N-acetyltransferase [Hungatella sp.]|jgi:ribosomal-protein-alanine N-acetyltransferase|nr:ribosomal protein S18-alanine N-acetyltransferase [Hungatella sp.]